MENLIENAKKIIDLNDELNGFRTQLKSVEDTDTTCSFELRFHRKKSSGLYSYYIFDKEECEFIINFIQECLQKRIDKKEAELNQYVISKKI